MNNENNIIMRAKMELNSILKLENGEDLKFTAVCKNGYPADGLDEDNTFAKFSPSAKCEISVRNENLYGKLIPGKKYYVDFTPAND